MKLVISILAIALGCGCSVQRFAVNRVGDALSGSGATFAADNDPELIRDAAPFSLKLMESLLAESPRHRGLLLAATSGFTQYSFAFVQAEADETEGTDLAKSRAERERARKLYVRARGYGLRGLEVSHPGFGAALREDPDKAVKMARKQDVAMLFWTAAAWGGEIVLSKDRPEVVANQPKVQALIDRALALDESFERGLIHSFLIGYEMARPGVKPADAQAAAEKHFARAVELGGGRSAGPYVSLAEAVCVQRQDRKRFEELLKTALAIDVDQVLDQRLANLIAQRRARWLLGRTDELFLE